MQSQQILDCDYILSLTRLLFFLSILFTLSYVFLIKLCKRILIYQRYLKDLSSKIPTLKIFLLIFTTNKVNWIFELYQWKIQ